MEPIQALKIIMTAAERAQLVKADHVAVEEAYKSIAAIISPAAPPEKVVETEAPATV